MTRVCVIGPNCQNLSLCRDANRQYCIEITVVIFTIVTNFVTMCNQK